MTTFLFATLAFVAIGSVIAFLAVRHAPEGYEDETGFHAVRPARVPVASTRDDSSSLRGDHLAGGLA